MAKQFHVNLTFGADTTKAKQEIQSLQKALQNVAKLPGQASSLFDDTQLNKASQAALELERHLSRAVNLDTGRLDLSRFSSSLKASNKSLSEYCNTLLSTGEVGKQAFLELAQAIAVADAPVARMNKMMTEFGKTLKNTAKWQISSSLLHGFMGSVQTAYHYAQDLNESLNNIRIVTGANVEEMSKFAAEANKAAKALSTTTTDYTNASLIYYQQGLSDQEVKERTDLTIKMANVARVSAEAASDQLTAIWNNFDNGTKSLEYYVDVMTALGAKTASSTDEIAGGLEKFAGIANTIGLSYEYATAAITTLTSNTRQSEEEVGTSLKTIFARIQGLRLGETLEDGVTLNKYSEALKTVGIDILDQNNNLKEMDTILDELGAKWSNISKAQQTALAQTVAGTRQYNQLVSLLDNWDKGDEDSFVTNVATARGSSGALQEQADIYAESWEAAQDRVTAAAEKIYASLINDEFFIDLLNGFEKGLETINGFIEGLGGIEGALGTIGSVFLTMFANKMPSALENFKQNFMAITGQSDKVMAEMQSQLNNQLANELSRPGISESYKVQLTGLSKVNEMKQKLVKASKNLTSVEQDEYEAKIRNVQAMYSEIQALAQKKEMAQEAFQESSRQAGGNARQGIRDTFKNYQTTMSSLDDTIATLEDKATTPHMSEEYSTEMILQLEEAQQKAESLEQDLTKIVELLHFDLESDLTGALFGSNSDPEMLKTALRQIEKETKAVQDQFEKFITKGANLESINESVKAQAQDWKTVAVTVAKAKKEGRMDDVQNTVEHTRKRMLAYLQTLREIGEQNGVSFDETQFQEMETAIQNLTSDGGNIENVTNQFEKFANVISEQTTNAIYDFDEEATKLRETLKALKYTDEDINKIVAAARGLSTAGTKLRDAMDNAGGQGDDPKGKFHLSVALTEATSLLMSVSSLINGVQNAMQTLTDEGATGWEKFGAAVGAVMPFMQTFNALTALSKTLVKQQTIANYAEAASKKFQTIADDENTAAIWRNTAAWLAHPAGWMAAVIMGVVAAVAALAIGIKVLTDNIDNSTKKAERAKGAAEALATSAEEAADSFNQIKTVFEEYDTVVEKLNECTKGTQEWQEALQGVNDKVKDILAEFPELASNADLFTYDASGALVLNQGERERVEKELSDRTNLTDSAALMANAIYHEADLQRKRDEALWSIGTKTVNSDIQVNLGSILVEHAKELSGASAEEYERSVRQYLQERIDSVYNSQYYSYTDTELDKIVELSKSYIPVLEELVDTSQAVNNEFDNIAKQDVENQLGDEYSANEKAFIAELYEMDLRTRQAQYQKDIRQTTSQASGSNNETYQDILKKLQQAGYDLRAQTGNKAVRGNDNNRVFAFTDSQGEEVLYSVEQIASILATKEALANLGSAAEKVTTTLAKLSQDELTSGIGSAVSSLITYNDTFNGMTGAEYASLDQWVYRHGGNVTADLLAQFLGLTAEEVLQLFEAEDDSDLHKKFSDAALKYQDALATAGSGVLTDSIELAWSSLVNDTSTFKKNSHLTAGLMNQLAELLNQAYVESGNLDALVNIYGKTSEAQQDELISALNTTNWATIDVDNLRKTLKDFGITAAFTDTELQELINSLSTAASKSGLSAEAFAALKNMDIGDTLSPEDFEKYADEYSNYFRLMADGTYQLTVDAEEFYRTISEGRKQALYDDLEDTPSSRALKSYGKRNLGNSFSAQVGGPTNTEAIGLQLDYLALAGYDSEQIKEWNALLRGKELTQDQANDIAQAVTSLLDQWDIVIGKAELNEKAIASQILSTANTLEEFTAESQVLVAKIATQKLDYSIIAQGLQVLASEYDNTYNELLVYKEALAYGTIEEIQQADNALRLAISIGEIAKEYDLSAESIERQAEQLYNLYKAQGLSYEKAVHLTIQNVRLNKGFKELTSNWDELSEALDPVNKGTSAYADAIVEVDNILRDLVGVSDDFIISTEFIADHFDLITAAANGSIDAINKLGIELARNVFVSGEADPFYTDIMFDDFEQAISQGLFSKNSKVTDVLGKNWVDQFVKMINSSNMTEQEIQDILDNLGLSATIDKKEIDDTTTTTTYLDADGKPIATGTTTTKKIVGEINAEDIIYTGNGILDPNALEELEEIQLDEIERYKEINDQLDILADKYDDAAKAADRLYGAARIAQLGKVSDAIQKEIDALESKKGEIVKYDDQGNLVDGYLLDDQNALKTAMEATGYEFEFDEETGRITNYTEIMPELQKWAKSNEDNAEQYENIVKLISTYDGTREELQNILNQIMEKTYAKQDNEFQQMTDILNYKLEDTSDKMQALDFQLSLLEDDFYKTAEAAALLFDTKNTDKIDLYTESIKAYETQVNDLMAAFGDGGDDATISLSAFVEGLKAAKDGLYDQLEALTSVDKQMLEYYSNTIAKANEELDKYTGKIDHLTSVLDHYKSILSVLGKNKDYAAMGSVLGGIVSTSKDRMTASIATYEMYKKEVEEKQALVNGAGNNEAAKQVYEAELEAAQEALAQAEEQMLQDTQSWAEAIKEQFRNTFEELGATLEAALLTDGGLSFDYLTTQMERATSLQEEYLTTTNKIYETTKLMRTAQQAIDASTNATVKSKLKNFITETQQLQNQTDLSKYELEIQQAKYDLLLAEIALEDAQNAKSVVRLQRDAAGNFGYVYTADDSQVSDAQQKVEDAQNNLYNIALEGAENYTNKQIEAMAKYQDEAQALTEQYLNGEIATQEEYQQKMQDLQNHYYEVLKNASYLYSVATTTDSRVIQESWSTDFQTMTVDAETWKNLTSEYISNCQQTFVNLKDELSIITAENGVMSNMSKRVSDITDESNKLTDAITNPENGVIKALQDELKIVSAVTKAYADQRKELTGEKGLIAEVKNYISTIDQALKDARELQTLQGSNTSNTENSTNTTTPPPATTDLVKGAGVKFTSSAGTTWANGKSIQAWVKNATFEVLWINDDGTVAIGNPNGSGGGYTGTVKAEDLQRFKSGGYTGEWGPGGKIAILDEKELILNQQDTANILATVESVRHILEILDLHTLSAQVGGLLSTPGYRSFESGALEQNVHIEASFPNVSDRNEIEEAFNNLVNKASQYANRK